jgi:hypothetical protein
VSAAAQVFLLEYEQAHPEDITGDDWISCDVSAERTPVGHFDHAGQL